MQDGRTDNYQARTAHEPSPAPAVTPEDSDYDERYFQTGLGLPYDESEPHWVEFFSDIADHVVAQLAPRTALDVGCAKGFLVAALAERGVDAAGVDISPYAIEAAVEGARGRVEVHSLTEPLKGRWDLVTCIEVLEHMAPPDTQRAIDNICAVTDRVLLSSTPHDFVEPSHVNVRSPATWASWFASRGFFRRTDLDLTYLSPWAVVVERRALTPVDVTYLYEVELAPLREELAVKRAALLSADRRIGDLLSELKAAGGTEVEPRYDIDRAISLIDQVIGLQAEIAQERYRHELALAAASEVARTAVTRRQEVERQVESAEARAAASQRQLTEMLASRSWRVGRTLARWATFSRRTPR
jgi:SAM-dependent methyltransferase